MTEEAAETGEVSTARIVARGMTRVVADHPAAVLLVDLDSRKVTYANDLARQLAPNVELPVFVDAWAQAAELQDATGEPLEDGLTSLRRVAAGSPVTGEQVTARRSSDVTAPREDMWVIGMPLQDAPAPLDRRALVVFLPLRDQEGIALAQDSSVELAHSAVLSSEVSFSISDPTAEDDPLVWVNPAFEAITGYRSDEVVGSNCRFLQGPGTDREAVRRIREGLAEGGAVTETLLNYRADGTAFWNHIVISPIYDEFGTLTHHVGVQADVTERVDSDRQRDLALKAAGVANDRLAALAAISAELAERIDSGESIFTRLPGLVARYFDGWIVSARLEDEEVMQVTISHRDERMQARTDMLRPRITSWLQSSAGRAATHALLARLRTTGVIATPVSERAKLAVLTALSAQGDGTLAALVGDSLVVAPLVARGRYIGLLCLVSDGVRGGHDAEEVRAVADLGIRAGIALDNARMYEQQRNTALLLQRSLLPKLPSVPGFEIAATYEPARNQDEVGGDWYDVINLRDEPRIAVTIGDVMGHDLRAAAAMGQLRSVLRSVAWTAIEPAEVIARLDELAQALDIVTLATCAYAVVHSADDGSCTVSYTLAGHLPPIIRYPNGHVTFLGDAVTSPVGVPDGRRVQQAAAELPLGAYLVLYSDGLVERRHADLDNGLDALAAVLADAPEDFSAEELCSYVVSSLTDADHDDDVCVLILRRTA